MSNLPISWTEFESTKATNDNSFELILFALATQLELSRGSLIHDTKTLVFDTDGSDDKGCDYAYLNYEDGHLIIIQAYWPELAPLTKQVKISKIQQLTQAYTWFMEGDLKKVKDDLSPIIEAFRDLRDSGQLVKLEFWYLHTQLSNASADAELQALKQTASKALPNITIDALQVNPNVIEDWHKENDNSISVQGDIHITPVNSSFIKSESTSWDSLQFEISANELKSLYIAHGDPLFKYNVRGYLGYSNAGEAINKGIREMLIQEPHNFAAYHNGITALTRKFTIDAEGGRITLDGISIVNGAQTTSVIGKTRQKISDVASLSMRIVRSTDEDFVKKVKRYNNTQNKILAEDFRASEESQEKLRQEFGSKYPSIIYTGGERGRGVTRQKGRKRLDFVALTRQLYAFHVDPSVAQFESKTIIKDDERYRKIFNSSANADHCIFISGLQHGLSIFRSDLKSKSEEELSSIQQSQHKFLYSSGGIFLALYFIGEVLEDILNRGIPDKNHISFRNNVHSIEEAGEKLQPLISVVVEYLPKLQKHTGLGLRNSIEIESTIQTTKTELRVLLAASGEAIRGVVSELLIVS